LEVGRRTILVLGLALTACAAVFAGGASSSSTNAERGSAAKLIIGYSDPLAAEQTLRAIAYGEREAIKQLRLPWTVKELNANLSSDKQVSDIDAFVSLKAAGITTWTLDQGAADAAYARAHAAGIPLLGFNSNSKYFASSINTRFNSTCDFGNQSAAYIARRVPHAKLLAVGGPPVPALVYTKRCFLNAAKRLGLRLLELKDDTSSTQAGGQKIMDTMLLQHPDVEAVWAFADTTGLGVSASLASAGKTIWSGNRRGVVLVSGAASQIGIDAIKLGKLTATWDTNNPQMGAAAIQVLKLILVDKKPASAIPKKVFVPTKLWDKSNAAQYVDVLHRAVTLPLK
jgi:ribose transport system substrate-binding protein